MEDMQRKALEIAACSIEADLAKHTSTTDKLLASYSDQEQAALHSSLQGIVQRLKQGDAGLLLLLFAAVPAPVKKPSPAEALEQTRATLNQWIADAQDTLHIPAESGEYPHWHQGAHDEITSCTTQIQLVEWLESHPECWTAAALEEQLRTRFRRLDDMEVLLSALPCFDEDEDELDVASMDQASREQYQQVKEHRAEQFSLNRQCDLLTCFLGVSARRLHDARHILGSYYYDEELRKSTKTTEAALCYPLIKAWMDGTAGTLEALPIPTFSAWLPEYAPRFPALV